MSLTQTITNTRLNGTHTFPFQNTADPSFTNALLTIDRTVNGGLNSLTSADTLTIAIDHSPDGGTTWLPLAAITCIGGPIVVKGVTLAQEQLSVGIDNVGTGFRVNTDASAPVRIAGTIVYS